MARLVRLTLSHRAPLKIYYLCASDSAKPLTMLMSCVSPALLANWRLAIIGVIACGEVPPLERAPVPQAAGTVWE